MIKFATYAVNSSRGRSFAEAAPRYRSDFQRDRDRVIHSSAFRRLEYKTQVFINHEGDLFRTRLTHSLEVAQVGRSVANALDLNVDLVEAICLAHDLGHTPFGHSGQDVLNECMLKHGEHFMAEAYSNSDIIIFRAGASTVAEVSCAGKCAIFVPYPYAVDNHQTHNANYLVEQGAAFLLPQSKLTPESLASLISELNPEKCQQIGLKAKSLAITNSTELICAAIS